MIYRLICYITSIYSMLILKQKNIYQLQFDLYIFRVSLDEIILGVMERQASKEVIIS